MPGRGLHLEGALINKLILYANTGTQQFRVGSSDLKLLSIKETIFSCFNNKYFMLFGWNNIKTF